MTDETMQLVIYGSSDDLLEVEGGITEELYLDGTTVTIVVTHRHATDVSAAPVENGVRA